MMNEKNCLLKTYRIFENVVLMIVRVITSAEIATYSSLVLIWKLVLLSLDEIHVLIRFKLIVKSNKAIQWIVSNCIEIFLLLIVWW